MVSCYNGCFHTDVSVHEMMLDKSSSTSNNKFIVHRFSNLIPQNADSILHLGNKFSSRCSHHLISFQKIVTLKVFRSPSSYKYTHFRDSMNDLERIFNICRMFQETVDGNVGEKFFQFQQRVLWKSEEAISRCVFLPSFTECSTISKDPLYSRVSLTSVEPRKFMSSISLLRW